jgi:nucleoside-diphosphate-sugar epimerase
MRLDLIINTMFKSAMRDRTIIVNNPSIWRPILSIEDAASAYIRAMEANYKISGIFNIASGNYTVGEVADRVRRSIETHTGWKINLQIKFIQDFRNYKVTIQKAQTVLSFHPQNDVGSIIASLIENRSKFEDWDNPSYYNIEAFKRLEASLNPTAWAAASVGSP